MDLGLCSFYKGCVDIKIVTLLLHFQDLSFLACLWCPECSLVLVPSCHMWLSPTDWMFGTEIKRAFYIYNSLPQCENGIYFFRVGATRSFSGLSSFWTLSHSGKACLSQLWNVRLVILVIEILTGSVQDKWSITSSTPSQRANISYYIPGRALKLYNYSHSHHAKCKMYWVKTNKIFCCLFLGLQTTISNTPCTVNCKKLSEFSATSMDSFFISLL